MPKKPTKSKRLDAVRDLTIKDFADCKSPPKRIGKGRLPKSQDVPDNGDDDDDDVIIEGKSRNRTKSESNEIIDPNHIYSDYHIDIWFLISEHIRPEDVCRFGLISRKTANIISTPKFWFNLYRRYYKENLDIPLRLKPSCMVRLGGLRACVIRSLFYTYQPFVERLKIPSDLSRLLNNECIGIWYKQIKDYWSFCYKFRRKGKFEKLKPDEIPECFDDEENFIQLSNKNIHVNPEDGCQLLVVFTERFYPLPYFFGQKLYLSSIIQPISQNLRNFKLEMLFTNYCNKEIVESVTYDPVKQCRLLAWWNPDYYSFLN